MGSCRQELRLGAPLQRGVTVGAAASPELAWTAARSCSESPVTHRGRGWPLSHHQSPWSHQGGREVEGLGRGSQPGSCPTTRGLLCSRCGVRMLERRLLPEPALPSSASPAGTREEGGAGRSCVIRRAGPLRTVRGGRMEPAPRLIHNIRRGGDAQRGRQLAGARQDALANSSRRSRRPPRRPRPATPRRPIASAGGT